MTASLRRCSTTSVASSTVVPNRSTVLPGTRAAVSSFAPDPSWLDFLAALFCEASPETPPAPT
eukprot:CAMPEP_0171913026 /NCGR_PEP_ID=MMETSP0993-20121228/11495_1 /TAXON_ID=483369 /ORGANISM="non described non described, Strain CCMP2098" /LENGTH=62 /DNA_ID=CAMNT_0012546963 /DNA_START=454 /DNA_END=639 /DNA_ORIENTATION=-